MTRGNLLYPTFFAWLAFVGTSEVATPLWLRALVCAVVVSCAYIVGFTRGEQSARRTLLGSLSRKVF